MARPLALRFLTYQKERFPLLVHGVLIAAFSFSAVSFSRLCRGVPGFIAGTDFLACFFTNLTLFFLLRVSDEHKDRDDDARYRSYLPVPRGLISLRELRGMAFGLLAVATAINILWYPRLLPLYGTMMGYLLLMRYEFGIPAWLRRHQVAYNLSHMLIIPLADTYASSYDWRLAGAAPPLGLLAFFGVSYLNGLVLEVGRKIRPAGGEEPGVISYTGLWGRATATRVWAVLLALNLVLATLAARLAGLGSASRMAFPILAGLCLIPAALFWRRPTKSVAKAIEVASLVWALGMYLLLGGVPMLLRLFETS